MCWDSYFFSCGSNGTTRYWQNDMRGMLRGAHVQELGALLHMVALILVRLLPSVLLGRLAVVLSQVLDIGIVLLLRIMNLNIRKAEQERSS